MHEHKRNLLKSARVVGCDTLAVFEPENLFYMTGFWGEAIGILESNGKTTIIAPELEVKRATSESFDCDIVQADRGSSMTRLLAKRVRGYKVCTDCRDYTTMSSLKRSVPKICNSFETFQRARMVKTANEICTLKRASKIIDEMFDLCTREIKVGIRESVLQSKLMSYAIDNEMFDTGYAGTLNPLIIAGGPNGALPHAQVTRRKFRRGDLVVVDLTLRYKGYVSDATRTFAIGKVSEQAQTAYDTVRESQRLGLGAVKPGVLCSDIDGTCRRYIEQQNFGEYFIHSTGHGIGLEVHELPWISKKSTTKLEKSMAITVEPGIYIEDKFGIRIEDSLIVQDRPVVMHKFTKDLITL